MSTWHDVGVAAEFVEDEPRTVLASGIQIAVFRVGDEWFALRDMCTHEVARLSEGFVEDGCVECPLHQGLFDLRTGEARKEPCVEAVQAFATRIMNDRLEIQVLPALVQA